MKMKMPWNKDKYNQQIQNPANYIPQNSGFEQGAQYQQDPQHYQQPQHTYQHQPLQLEIGEFGAQQGGLFEQLDRMDQASQFANRYEPQDQYRQQPTGFGNTQNTEPHYAGNSRAEAVRRLNTNGITNGRQIAQQTQFNNHQSQYGANNLSNQQLNAFVIGLYDQIVLQHYLQHKPDSIEISKEIQIAKIEYVNICFDYGLNYGDNVQEHQQMEILTQVVNLTKRMHRNIAEINFINTFANIYQFKISINLSNQAEDIKLLKAPLPKARTPALRDKNIQTTLQFVKNKVLTRFGVVFAEIDEFLDNKTHHQTDGGYDSHVGKSFDFVIPEFSMMENGFEVFAEITTLTDVLMLEEFLPIEKSFPITVDSVRHVEKGQLISFSMHNPKGL